jgi:hypothetical protein
MVEDMGVIRKEGDDRKGESIYGALGKGKVKLVGNNRSLTHCPR